MRCAHGQESKFTCGACADEKNHGEKTRSPRWEAPATAPRTFRSKQSKPAIGRTFKRKNAEAKAKCHEEQLGLTLI